MFSTHLSQVNTVPRECIYFGAGVVLIVSLLAAIASVARGEVEKAHARDFLLASQRSAMVYCVETLRGAALNTCMQQANADVYNDGSRTTVAANATGGAVLASGPTAPTVGATGLMPVSFSAVR